MPIPKALSTDKAPGGSLLAALTDRRLQAWSDRGGASQHIGERWSSVVAHELRGWIGWCRNVDGAGPARLAAVIRLDLEPAIERLAGQRGLTNPDFVLAYERADGVVLLQPADAKFAVERSKPEQIRGRALRALLDSGDPHLEQLVGAHVGAVSLSGVAVHDGFVVCPAGVLTEHALARVTEGRPPILRRDQVVTIDVDPRRLFVRFPWTRSVTRLASIDRLPVRPGRDLVASVYYLRLACACAWLWGEERKPLLSLEPPPALDPERLYEEVTDRATRAESAFGLIERWHDELDDVRRNREAIAPFLAPPLTNRELRSSLEAAGLPTESASLRRIRSDLVRWYRAELVARIGEIPSRPRESLPEVLQRLARLGRELEPDVRRWMAERIEAERAATPPVPDCRALQDR